MTMEVAVTVLLWLPLWAELWEASWWCWEQVWEHTSTRSADAAHLCNPWRAALWLETMACSHARASLLVLCAQRQCSRPRTEMLKVLGG